MLQERVCVCVGVRRNQLKVLIFMRNASVGVSHNAIVDVRRRLRRHEMILFEYLVRATNFKIYHDVEPSKVSALWPKLTPQSTSGWQ